MREYLVEIINDCFDIARDLAHLGGYKIYYNKKNKRYEVYRFDRLEIVLPFDCLDYRTIELVRKTAKQNADTLFEEMDKHNENLLKMMMPKEDGYCAE